MTRRLSVLSCTAIVACMTACAAEQPNAHPAKDASALQQTFVFMCPDGSDYVVRATGSEAWVFRPGSGLRLKAVASAGQSRYANDQVRLAIDGENGLLSEPGKTAQSCRNDRQRAVWERAKLDGVDFRAVGNEPPWVLEIREQSRLVLITDYGANRIERSLPQPINDTTNKTTRWDAGDLQIEVSAGACAETMSGEKSESRVVVRWQGRVLSGCGRPLH